MIFLKSISILTILAVASAGLAADPASAPDLEAQYQNVLAVMKNPPVTGILVTEIMAGSPAGAAGLQAGDIITYYHQTRILDLKSLTQEVADAYAHRIEEGEPPPGGLRISNGNVLLAIRRDGKDQYLQVPRDPLGIRAIEVVANVPAPRNPPPSARGSIKLAWNELPRPTAPEFLRLVQPGADGRTDIWIGWQKTTLLPSAPDALDATLELTRINPDDPPPQGKIAEHNSVSFHLRTGDYAAAPAFVLDSITTLNRPGTSAPDITAQRLGESLQADLQNPAGKSTPPCPLDALPQSAIPFLAAAMPHEKDAALALHLLSLKDLQSRPGYLLITRGQAPPPAAPSNPQAWRVDLIHCGLLIESYYFSDERRLLLIQSPSPNPILGRRVLNEDEASQPALPKPASTRP